MKQLFRYSRLALLTGAFLIPLANADTLVWNEGSWGGNWSTPVFFRVAVSGNGDGAIVTNGVRCEDSCEITMDSGTLLELMADAEQGSHIASWGTPNCDGINVMCQYRLMATEDIEASFVRLSTTGPNPIEIPINNQARPGEYAEFGPITIDGIDGPVLVSLDSGEISVGCTGEYTAGPVLVNPGEVICVRHLVTAERPYSEFRTILTIGGMVVEIISVVEPGRKSSFIIKLIPILQPPVEDNP